MLAIPASCTPHRENRKSETVNRKIRIPTLREKIVEPYCGDVTNVVTCAQQFIATQYTCGHFGLCLAGFTDLLGTFLIRIQESGLPQENKKVEQGDHL